MLRKLFAVITIFVFGSVCVLAQDKPPVPAKPDKPKTYSFGTFFDGSYLGVQTKEVTKENFSQYGLRDVRGVAVEKVVENSPAAQAGLQSGDVIIKFQGEDVTSIRKLERLVSEVAPDHKAVLTVFRNGSEREISVTMGKREFPKFENSIFMEDFPNIPPLPAIPDMPKVQISPMSPLPSFERDGETFYFASNRQIGVSVSTLTKQLGDYFGIPEGKGVLITNVREDSPAGKAGLKAGDVIVEVDGKEVKSAFDLTRFVNEKKEGTVNLTVIRNRSRQTVTVEPAKSGTFKMLTPESRNRIKISPKAVAAPKVVMGSFPGRIL